jgi:hypothetical protein
VKLRPYRQGALDSLCGVYAVVNATRLAAWPLKRLTADSCEELFRELAYTLDADRQLLDVLTEGSCFPVLSRLLRAANSWLEIEYDLQLRFRRPHHKRSSISAVGVLEQVTEHLVAPQTAAIVGIRGPHGDHWSVARGVSKSRSILLLDSGARRFVRSELARPKPTGTAPRLLHRHLYLIWTTA